jgi:hypothetical protein
MKGVIRLRSPLEANATRTTLSRRTAKLDWHQTGRVRARSIARFIQTISEAAYPRRFACTDIHHPHI